jgi:hypothetical protein
MNHGQITEEGFMNRATADLLQFTHNPKLASSHAYDEPEAVLLALGVSVSVESTPESVQ